MKQGIEINSENCSRCGICTVACPFDALSVEEEKIVLDIEKCQICGVCYGLCPAGAIESIYYDIESLVRYLESKEGDTLVITCRGSTPTEQEIKELTGTSDYIHLCLPCVGKMRMEFLLRAVTLGMKRIFVIPCEEEYCRFEKGSKYTTFKISLLKSLFEYIGYPTSLELHRNKIEVSFDRYKCLGCGNCEVVCSYDAVQIKSPGVASFDLDACMGCGRCVAVCPALAIDIKNSEHEQIASEIAAFASEAKDIKPKVLVLGCQWAEYSSLDTIKPRILPENVKFIGLPCSGRVDPLHILEALNKGIDGVLVVACPEEGCRFEGGTERAEKNISELKEKLNQIGMAEKVEICFVSPKYPGQFEEELNKFLGD
jgi:coenzyme F420-reducing hydrogenase delta subunit/Pyruvate/2-oxoacid:ferredoxin oxidoreductase delta subunit